MENKQKIIYILGLGHSGSTVLDLLLSSHPQIISLGEITFILQDKGKSTEGTKEICSCGQPMTNCSFWSGFKKKFNYTFLENYAALMQYAQDKLNPNIIISDSSKKLGVLKELVLSADYDIKVIFLVRDIRGWALSMKRVFKKDKRKANFYLRHLIKWGKEHKKIRQYLDASGLDYLKIKYQDLCLKPQEINQRIVSFLGVQDYQLDIRNAKNHHLAFGNRLKFYKINRLEYNDKWKKKLWLRMLSLPFFLINKKYLDK